MSTTPICRCRVLYLGSAVPHITKDGLQGIQEPLRELYPGNGAFGAHGIDTWLSVWSNGILLENVDESRREISRFFDIDVLHYCAAVRYVLVSDSNGGRIEKFLPLDSPFARHANLSHPPVFACIMRRTEGIKVLECHAFVCKKEAAANALVRSCFHAYADSVYARQVEENPYLTSHPSLNSMDKVAVWRQRNGHTKAITDDNNYKVWKGQAPTERDLVYVDATGTIRSIKSNNSISSKPRQMIMPSRPPPTASLTSVKSGKGSKRLAKNKNKKHEQPFNGYRTVHPIPVANIYAGSGLYTERLVRRPDRPALSSIEEPSYLPSVSRPLSPTASYQPSLFPHDQYFQNGIIEKKEDQTEGKELDSLFNTGIYRKKGHLNERAFSFSIRQEHRSRSNSLANLHFYPPPEDTESVGGDQRIEDRKERELAQLVNDLDLKDHGSRTESNFIRKKAPAYQR